MKFEIEIEATPAEARAFLGMPDLTPLHEVWIERMKALTPDFSSPDDWQKLAKQWSSGMPGISEGFEAWQKLMASAMPASSQTTPPKE